MMARIQRSLILNSCERSEYEAPCRHFRKRFWLRTRRFAAVELGIQSFLSEKQCRMARTLTLPVPGLRVSMRSMSFCVSKGLTRQVKGRFVFVSCEIAGFPGQRRVESGNSFTFPPRVDLLDNCEKFMITGSNSPNERQ